MNQLIWLNGEIMPMSQATIGVEDRGFQFADGVYEVIRFYNGRLFTLAEHMRRLARSAEGLRLPLAMPVERIGRELEAFVPRTGLRDGMIYLQATRGVSPRNHVFPKEPHPTLLFYSKPLPPPAEPGCAAGLRVLPVADERWKRCWIKTVGLIGHILAKNDAVDRGFDEAAFVENGMVSECSTSNFFIIRGGRLITHPADARILAGITRGVVLQCAEKLGVAVEQRPPRVEEIRQGEEVFITSTTKELAWVSHWGERPVGQGRTGEMTLRLHRAFQERVRAETEAERIAVSAA